MKRGKVKVAYVGGLSELRGFLCDLLQCDHEPASFQYSIGMATPKKNKHMHLDLQISTLDKIPITITKPGDGAPVWTIEDGPSTINTASDGLAAELISSDFPSETTYSITGTRGGNPINDSITLTVVEAPPGEDFGLVAGAPIPKNAPTALKK